MFVYLISATGTGLTKIGKAGNPHKRLRQLSHGPVPVALLHKIATNNMAWLEAYLHSLFAASRVCGEWFRLSAEEITRLKGFDRMDQPEALSPLNCNGTAPPTPRRKRPRRTGRERQLLAILRDIRDRARSASKDVTEGRACFAFLAGTVRNIAKDLTNSLASCKTVRLHKPTEEHQS